MRKKIITVSAANGATALLALARNILIARLIGVEDFGVASTFAITVALLEMAGVGLPLMIVQARDGGCRSFVSTIQSLHLLRSALGAVVIFATSWPLAALFGRPDIAWAYQILALVPLLRGMRHLDLHRAQRENRFGPAAAADVSAGLAGVLAVWPAALAFGDFRVMLVALIVHDVVRTVVSHLVAGAPFTLGWRRDVLARAFEFGWPILLNGLLMFWVFQGDRVIVGGMIGLEALGWFSAAFGLLLMPTTVIASTLQTLLLPRLSRLQDDPVGFETLARLVVQACVAVSAAMAAGVALAGPAVFLTAYGAPYAPGLAVFALLGVASATRLVKVAPTILAMAKGQTRLPLYGNLLRAGFVLVGAGGVWIWRDPQVLVVAAIMGETLATAFMLRLCSRRLGLPLRPLLPVLLIGAAILATTLAYFLAAPSTPAIAFTTDAMRIAIALSPLVLLVAAPDLRRWLWRMARGEVI